MLKAKKVIQGSLEFLREDNPSSQLDRDAVIVARVQVEAVSNDVIEIAFEESASIKAGDRLRLKLEELDSLMELLGVKRN